MAPKKYTAERLYELRQSDPALFEAIVGKLREEKARTEDPPFVKDMFPEQLAFFRDQSRRKVALCGRRAGKSFAVACTLIAEGLKDPGGLSLYIATSRSQCRNIMWRVFIELRNKYKLTFAMHERDNQLTITLDNGHEIQLQGAPDIAAMTKFRGLKCMTVAIDEAAMFPEWIRDLVEDVLSPVLLDKNGQLILISTPGIVPVGLFYEITTGEGIGKEVAQQWSAVHHWTVLDNIYIPHAKEWLAEKRASNRWTEEHPRYRREWRGQWVDDTASRPFPYKPERNNYLRQPDGDGWITHMGVDIGFSDDTAITIMRYRRGQPAIYVVMSEKYHAMIPSSLAAMVQKLKQEHGVSLVVMDTGGIGRGYAEEMSQRYGVYTEPAEKTKKRAFIEIFRGEILSGVLRFNPRTCEPLITEMRAMTWNEDMSDFDDRHDDHCIDSALYVCRSLMPHYRPVIIEPPKTQADLDRDRMCEHRARIAAEIRRGFKQKMRTRSVMHDIAMGR